MMKRDLSTLDLSRLSGVDNKTIWNIINKKYNSNLENVCKILNVLEGETFEEMCWDDNMGDEDEEKLKKCTA